MQIPIKYITHVFLVSVLVLSGTPLTFTVADENKAIECLHLNSILEKKRQLYSDDFPDILFVIAKGGDKWIDDMNALSVILGYQPVNLDYEHPTDLREELMIVSLERLVLMLRHHVPSSSLFKADEPLGYPGNVCVLTIDPDAVADSHRTATLYLGGLSEQHRPLIREDKLIRCDDYVNFMFDHEAYHCLHSLYVGPQSMSEKELWGEYSSYNEEQGANAFAMAMQIKNGVTRSGIDNLLRLRELSLLSSDPNHWTCNTLKEVSNLPEETISKSSIQELFEFASDLQKQREITYNQYLQYLVNSLSAIKELGIIHSPMHEHKDLFEDVTANETRAKELADRCRKAYRELTNQEYAPE